MTHKTISLIAVDVGNTSIGIGFFPDSDKSSALTVRKMSTRDASSASRIRWLIAALLETAETVGDVRLGCIISSVVPSVLPSLVEALARWFPSPVMVNELLAPSLLTKLPHPSRVGSDRIANALAAWHKFRRPVAVIDCGTATTITVAGRGGHLFGGAILPGIELMSVSLAQGTAKLPAVKLTSPQRVLGIETSEAIRSGILYGTAGAVDRIVTSIERELRSKFSIVLTGGRADIVSPLLERDHLVDHTLIYKGLRLLYLMSNEHKKRAD